MATIFHKMHGAGNDFVLLDLRQQRFAIDADRARALADRHTGVGCDQLLVLRQPADSGCLADFEVWNADGSRAEQCGNGVRCIGLYLFRCGETSGGTLSIGGPVARIDLEVLDDGQVRVDMGNPDFNAAQVPISTEPVDGWHSIETGNKTLQLGAVSMGNPHALLPVSDVSSPEISTLGAAISRHPAFPHGCNAGFAQVVDPGTIRLRVFERGAGETRACGSGACAAVAILQRAGLVGEKVRVLQEGGTLIIEWQGNHAHLMMTGPAIHVFEGTLT